MRRQRYIYTLPSQDDTAVVNDSDSTSIISSHFSYPETVWSQIIGNEPEALVPLCIYQYPYFQVTPEQLSGSPGTFNSTMTPGSLHSLDSINHYNDEFAEGCNFVSSSPICSTPYGDGFNSEEFSYNKYVSHENIDAVPQEMPCTCPMVTNYGAVSILLRHLIRVDISPAKALYVTNPPSSCVAAINGTGDKSCVIHPNGRVLCDNHDIHMSTLNRKAKLSKRGIVFTSADHCLSYVVDASGTKTTAEKFRDLNQDFSLEVFYNYAMAQEDVEECFDMVDAAQYKSYWNGDEVWFIGGYRIKQDQRGDVKVTRNSGRQIIRSSPTTGQVFVKSFQSEFSIGRYPNNYFQVRRGDKQVTASLRGFSVQNGTQKAGINGSGKVVLF